MSDSKAHGLLIAKMEDPNSVLKETTIFSYHLALGPLVLTNNHLHSHRQQLVLWVLKIQKWILCFPNLWKVQDMYIMIISLSTK